MKARPSGVETENTKIEAEFDSAWSHKTTETILGLSECKYSV